MKVSVIIPTYNREKYICQAIESVLNQTMNNIEIIVVDDGSTDNTREIIKPYKDRIEYINTKNGGPAHARNVGMKIAKGEYIAFLDSDDLYYPYKTELQVNFLDKFPDIAMVCTEFSAFDDNGYWDEYHLKKFHTAYKNNTLTYEDIFPECTTIKEAGLGYINWADKKVYMGEIYNIHFQNIIVGTPTVVFRRDILKKVGMQDTKFRLFEEYEFVLRITKFYRVAFIDVPTYKYRYHHDQISVANNKEQKMQILIMKQTNLLEIAQNHGLNDKNYYSKNKDMVNKRLAIVHKALAIPLMVKGNDNIRARKLLRKCDFYEHPEHFLWLVTFAPYLVRRVVVKVLSLLKAI